jgi:hypothetical protein
LCTGSVAARKRGIGREKRSSARASGGSRRFPPLYRIVAHSARRSPCHLCAFLAAYLPRWPVWRQEASLKSTSAATHRAADR